MKFLTAVIIAIVLEVCNAHLCMLSPPQRGSMMGINKAGANDCILTAARCGGRPAGHPVMGLKTGTNFTVTFQKNLDHYDKATPGSFQVAIGQERTGTEMKNLVSIPDAGEPSLTLYSVNVTIPTGLVSRQLYVLQTAYVTNNKQAPAVFYQCADIIVEG
ncbi:hypothetical protein KP79_PYT13743 [Mizuhopecten yessoensis]|uniref:Uncharacterized protein n=1 Tax=Mizuhopecten yessoensis TaxID=6573 RepID=A0A210QV54_MIZYE|nr:hypothetical protein KP79_PYT13743 [Mizuhopecten yessoensis]